MLNIEEFILFPLEKRQAHLKLNEPCIERGGNPTIVSWMMRGVLAHILDTSIPFKKKICICHACHNGKCNNPYHVYWGTYRENRIDARTNGQKSPWFYSVEKYGLEEAKKINARRGNTNGKGNKGQPKPLDVRRKISSGVKSYLQEHSTRTEGSTPFNPTKLYEEKKNLTHNSFPNSRRSS